MASPFLAQLALGYAQKSSENAQTHIDQQRALELDQRKRDLDLKYEKLHQQDLNDLAYEGAIKTQNMKDEYQTQQNQRYGQGLLEAASKSIDPTERRALTLHGNAFLNAGSMPPKDVVDTMKAMIPPKMTATDRTAERELRDRQNFDQAITSLDEVDPDKLATDPKMYQALYQSHTKGLSPQYRKLFKEQMETLVEFHSAKKNYQIPQQIQDQMDMYRKTEGQMNAHIISDAHSTTPLGEEQVKAQYIPQLNDLAAAPNQWSQQQHQEDILETYTPETTVTPRNPLLKALGFEDLKETTMKATKKAAGGPSVTPQKTIQQRGFEIHTQNPQMSDDDIDTQLKKEGYQP